MDSAYLTAEQKQLFSEHLYVADHAVRKFSLMPCGVMDKDDLYQAACMGLMQAASRYDPDHDEGASFESFAGMRVWGAMIDELRDVLHIRLKCEPPKFFPASSRWPSNGRDDDKGDWIADNCVDPHLIAAQVVESDEEVHAYMRLLRPRERTFAVALMGGNTLKEAGRQVGVCESRACQIRDKFLKPVMTRYIARRAMSA